MSAVPYGSWPSAVGAEEAASVADRFDGVDADGTGVYWLENRPREGGRSVVCHRTADGHRREITPAGFDVRSRAYGYGGGAWTVHGGALFAVNQPDERVYRLDPGRTPVALTPPGDGSWRHGDLAVSADGSQVFCVRDGAEGAEIAAIPNDGSGHVRTLVTGTFLAAARPDPTGRFLAWISWEHPDMPWDRTVLHVAAIGRDGRLGAARTVAGAGEESVLQPSWSPDGVLHFLSDRTGWWNLYRADEDGVRAVAPIDSELTGAPWTLGMRCYDFLPGERIACLYGVGPYRRLGVIERGGSGIVPVATSATWIAPRIRARGERVVCVAADPTTAPELTEIDTREPASPPSAPPAGTGRVLSEPRLVDFPTGDGTTGYGLYYPPANPGVTAPDGPPPLIVNCHGGPTAGSSSQYHPDLQFFATRGFAVLDVDYAGSAGYGRDYRRRLAGSWGVRDVADCVAAAQTLVARGLADRDRLVVRGASAGGYTALCAVTFTSVFAAAVSYYGIGDLDALARETHRFESRYADRLLGGPAGHPVYRERSPLHNLDRLRRPVLLLHGTDDTIVPPGQAHAVAEALSRVGLWCEHLAFAGEGHGFRRADTVRTALRTELAFYGRVLGFTPAGPPPAAGEADGAAAGKPDQERVSTR